MSAEKIMASEFMRDIRKSKSRPGKETGIEEMRRAVRVADMCRESAFDGWTAEEVLNLIRACWASEWDVYPDMLTFREKRYAARFGKFSVHCNARLRKELDG